MTERLHFHFSLSCFGEANGNPLQCSCLENPRDGGAWWAAVSGVAQSRIRLKRLSSSSKGEAGNISEETMSKRNGDEENVPGRGTVCTKAWRKALLRMRYLWRSPVGWSPKCERREGMQAGELRSQAGARGAVWALLWGQ